MSQRVPPEPAPPAAPFGRAARAAARAHRAAGDRLVRAALRHLLDTMRRTERCAPWRSGRTVKDLERRSGLLGPAAPERAPLVAPLLELLLRDGVVVRRAGHYRLSADPPQRCPACGGGEYRRVAPPDPPDDALGNVTRLVCGACGGWCGVVLPPPEAPARIPPGAPGGRGGA
jgi:hypothetical protein